MVTKTFLSATREPYFWRLWGCNRILTYPRLQNDPLHAHFLPKPTHNDSVPSQVQNTQKQTQRLDLDLDATHKKSTKHWARHSSLHQLHHTHPSITLTQTQLDRVTSYSAVSLMSHLSLHLFRLLGPIPLELMMAEGQPPHLVYASSISTLLAYHTQHHHVVSHPSSHTRRVPRSCSGRTRYRGSRTTPSPGTTPFSTPS